MILDSLRYLFDRDIKKLRVEIEAYTSDSALWLYPYDIKNSGGNLCLHLIGNLNAYIGNGLARAHYNRDRDREFAAKNIPINELLSMLDKTREIVNEGLNSITEADLSADFPIIIWDHKTNMAYTLMHLHSHLNYHLGQINYHRRLLDVDREAIQ